MYMSHYLHKTCVFKGVVTWRGGYKTGGGGVWQF